MALQHMQIGEVAEQTGLSMRTIRYYEEVGLVTPSSRTTGGFRLYSDLDVARLRLIMRMKRVEFSLEETKDVLGLLDALEQGHGSTDASVLERLQMYHELADARVASLREQLEVAEGFASDLRREISRQKRLGRQSR